MQLKEQIFQMERKYSKRTSVLHVFIPRTGSRLLGMRLPGTFWLGSIAWGLALGVFIRPCTNEILLPRRIAMWRHQSNRRPGYFSVHHASGSSRSGGLTVLDDNI